MEPAGSPASTSPRGPSATGGNCGTSSTITSTIPPIPQGSPRRDAPILSPITPTPSEPGKSSGSSGGGVCSVPECDSPARSRGWCRRHYLRWYKTGDPLGVRPGRWEGYERPTCTVTGCTEPAHARGLCSVHGPRMRRHGDPLAGRQPNKTGTHEERFLAFTKRRPNGCLGWTGARTTGGYGEFTTDGITVYAHRWAHEHWVGSIPDGLTVDHTCHNRDRACPGGACSHRSCVEPEHLEAVTSLVNFQRGRERLR
jgi:hypothetical protein